MVSGDADAGRSAGVLEMLTSKTARSLTESGLESLLTVFCSHLHQLRQNALMGAVLQVAKGRGLGFKNNSEQKESFIENK